MMITASPASSVGHLCPLRRWMYVRPTMLKISVASSAASPLRRVPPAAPGRRKTTCRSYPLQVIGLRERMASARRRHIVLASCLALGAILVLAHSGISSAHDPEAASHDTGDMLSMCMAIVDLGLVFALMAGGGPRAQVCRERLSPFSHRRYRGHPRAFDAWFSRAALQVFRL